MPKDRVLFVCTDGARSQMAAAILQRYAGQQFEACCAALEPAVLCRHMARSLQDHGVEPLSVWLNPLTSMRGAFRYLLALDDSIEMPASLAGAYHCWPIDDPSAVDTLEAFEQARDQIEGLIFDWLNKFEERFVRQDSPSAPATLAPGPIACAPADCVRRPLRVIGLASTAHRRGGGSRLPAIVPQTAGTRYMLFRVF